MVTRSDYPEDGVAAARAVLIELGHLLGEYRDDVVVIRGWVPELLFGDASVHHIGSLDVDLALNHRTLQEAGYRTIHELLLERGYFQQLGDQPFRYYRKVPIEGRELVVEVDFLAGEYAGTARSHRTQKVQEMQPRKARGCDLAFGLSTEVSIAGFLPDGSLDSTRIRVANALSFLVMKAIALDTRMKEKDAWDIYYCLTQYPGGLDRLAEAFRPHLGHGLVREGLQKLAGKFRSPDDFGPASVARFEEVTDPEVRALRQRDAFERMAYLLGKLNDA